MTIARVRRILIMSWKYSLINEILYLADSPDTEGEITSESPAVAKRKLKSEVDENALVAEYLKKVSPGIARKFQV